MTQRTLGLVLAAGLVLTGVAGCRTSPDVAAYVGDDRVTTTQLQDAVDERLADEAVAAYAAGLADGGYTRQVLDLMIGARVYDEVAERYDVEVTDRDVSARLAELLDGEDEDALFAQLAQQQGLAPADAREIIRELLIREEVAQAEGLADLGDAGVEAAYEEARAAGQQFEFGYITVPDQATADAVVAALVADPAAYAALAEQYAGNFTLAAPELRSVEELPSVLLEPVANALPDGVFSLAVAETGGIVVGQVTFPPIEDLEAELTSSLRQAAADAAVPLVDQLEADLAVVVNPRYGSLVEGSVVPVEDGVVRILEDAATDAATDPATDPAAD